MQARRQKKPLIEELVLGKLAKDGRLDDAARERIAKYTAAYLEANPGDIPHLTDVIEHLADEYLRNKTTKGK